MLYRKVDIKSKADYPKGGDYFCCRNGLLTVQHLLSDPPNESYMREIRWYLQPLPEQIEDKYPDTEADGYVFCGKCGAMKQI
jgi:hypothetical protein